jgi:hypothetical protein
MSTIQNNKDIENSIITYRFFKEILKISEDKSLQATLQLESILQGQALDKFEKFVKFNVMKQANDFYYDCRFNEFRNRNFN